MTIRINLESMYPEGGLTTFSTVYKKRAVPSRIHYAIFFYSLFRFVTYKTLNIFMLQVYELIFVDNLICISSTLIL